MGNIYESAYSSNRVYGVGSRLERSGVDTKDLRNLAVQMSRDKWNHELVAKGTTYTYDAEGNYSIISDYLGTPVEAYDADGEKVWSAELDIYGRVAEHHGDVDFIPFRYQGQYHDIETGLYYNRFRYYDPEMGQYTQPDPIGLEGGNPTLYGYIFNLSSPMIKCR
jgi:RHS repeat-associated protein